MKIIYLGLVLAALSTAGCVKSAGTRVALNTSSGEAYIAETNAKLAYRLDVVRATYEDVNGIKKATISLVSRTQRRQHLQARMVWYDANGAAIDAESKPFRSIILDGYDTYAFTGLAPNDKCVTAKLVIREAKSAQ